MLFYIIEAVAVMAVLKQHPNDADAAVSAYSSVISGMGCCEDCFHGL